MLPLRYAVDHRNLRWSLGSHDICYKNSLTGHFFCAGQTLPTHRLRHSPWGGLFQPTMNQAVRLLSAPIEPLSSSSTSSSSLPPSLPSPATTSSSASPSSSTSSTSFTSFTSFTSSPPSLSPHPSGPPKPVFTSSFPPALYYSTDDVDRWPAPAAYADNRHAWVHIFPEGLVHQQRDRGLRYFKWGVARLLLESEPAPDIVPMFIDGLDRVMAEDRGFPRFLPRVGQSVRIVFGNALDPAAFADLRTRWRQLQRAAGCEVSLNLLYGPEAQQLRIEAAERMRREVLQLRRRFGYPDEDPQLARAGTWADEPNKKRYRSQVDDSMVYRE